MKLAFEVEVPPRVLISTELLGELIGNREVIALLQKGKILPGQKRHTRRTAVSDDEVSAAQADLAQATALLDATIQGVTK